MGRVSNTMEWFLGGTNSLLQQAAKESRSIDQSLSTIVTTLQQRAASLGISIDLPDLPESPLATINEALGLLDSVSRCIEDLSNLSMHSLHDWLLCRRDAELEHCEKDLDRQARPTLRCHDLSSPHLLNATEASSIYERYKDRSDRATMSKAMTSLSKKLTQSSAPKST